MSEYVIVYNNIITSSYKINMHGNLLESFRLR